MGASTPELNRFALKHEGHGGEMWVVPEAGRQWMTCSRCRARIEVTPDPETRDLDERVPRSHDGTDAVA